MNKSTRKILRRMGAGLLLGLSLFNVGAAWSKSDNFNIGKRAKRIKTKEKEKYDTETASMMEVVEDEARKVIQENQQTQSQINTQKEISGAQKFYRITATGIMIVGIGLFGSSMIFNFPFALGKGFLSVLPGNPHVASIMLSTPDENAKEGKRLQVSALINSSGDSVDGVKLVILFDPNQLDFEKIDSDYQWIAEEKQLDETKSQLVLTSKEKTFRSQVLAGKDVAKIGFWVHGVISGDRIGLAIDEESSLIMSNKDDIKRNILGHVRGLNLETAVEDNPEFICQEMKEITGGVDFWQQFTQGDPLNPRSKYWERLSRESGMICAHNNEALFFVVVVPEKINLNNFDFVSNQFNLEINEPEYKWKKDEFQFYVYQLSRENVDTMENVRISLKENFVTKLHWPLIKKGKIKIEK